MLNNANKILVTGATGFIGTSLCNHLHKLGMDVSGTIRVKKNDSDLTTGVTLRCVDDIGPETDWSQALKGVDTVIHLAARAHIMRDSATDALAQFRRINVAGTERLVRQAVANGIQRMIYLSSIKVNGESRSTAFTEQDDPSPEDPYGISKWEAEVILKRVAEETGLQIVIIRPPLVYGPGAKANFYKVLETVQSGIPLPLASIHNSRSLIYLGNIVDAITSCIVHSEAAGQTFLVSDGDDVSTPELIRRISVAMRKKPRLFPFPASVMRITGRVVGKGSVVKRLLGSLSVDTSKIRRELGWTPPFTMEQGLAETAAWFLKRSGQ